ncbi:hypothetical protein GCM10022247_70300 [Allokutzneria multivorans]|uniref:Uncharacterized protein n=1 Tax=Allokutzneria multivorans TaxID=1142134 RepID=A0ABP7U2K4_9PSEU
MKIRATAAAALSLAAMTLVAPGTAAAEPCGYYESGYGFHYNHCASGHVKVHVDVFHDFDYDICAHPGLNLLGLKVHERKIRNAWYVGGC